jgi:hypothetical protein
MPTFARSFSVSLMVAVGVVASAPLWAGEGPQSSSSPPMNGAPTNRTPNRGDVRSPPALRAPPEEKARTIAEAWQLLPQSGNGCGDDLLFDYGVGGGMRNFFCRALTVYSWKAFVAAAPVAPFRKGPHKGTRLNFKAERDFGRYDPRFVKWAVDTLVPAATDPALRARTQDIYNEQVRELARVYFLVDKALQASPKWVARERERYLVSMDKNGGGWDVWEITGAYHDVLGNSDANWGGHDPNHVRSAVMWWLRRVHDDTAPLWRQGLTKLLTTYDAEWLRDTNATKATTLDVAPAPPAPEYE